MADQQLNVQSSVDIATLASVTTSLGFIQSQMGEIRADVKSLHSVFASKEELANTARETQMRIVRLEKDSNLWKWLSPSLAAILGALLTYLVQFYLIHGGK